MTFWTKVMEGRNGIDTINMALLFMVLLFNLITKLVYTTATSPLLFLFRSAKLFLVLFSFYPSLYASR